MEAYNHKEIEKKWPARHRKPDFFACGLAQALRAGRRIHV